MLDTEGLWWLIPPPNPLSALALLSQLWVAHNDCDLREQTKESSCSDNLFRKSTHDPVWNRGYRQRHLLNYLNWYIQVLQTCNRDEREQRNLYTELLVKDNKVINTMFWINNKLTKLIRFEPQRAVEPTPARFTHRSSFINNNLLLSKLPVIIKKKTNLFCCFSILMHFNNSSHNH